MACALVRSVEKKGGKWVVTVNVNPPVEVGTRRVSSFKYSRRENVESP
ncbi:MAG: hypothetical protein ABGY09_00675 [Euryarchaeota archaeon]